MDALPRLVLIADTATLPEDALVDVAARALEAASPGSLTLLSRDGGWRDPKTPDATRLHHLRRLRALSRDAGCSLVVSARADLAQACEADGVHLPSRGVSVEATRLAFPHVLVSRSCHDRASLDEARRQGADWITVSPLFAPLSKPADRPPLGTRGFETLVVNGGVPVFALGGITAAGVGDAIDAGAYGVACLGSVLHAPDPGAIVASLLAALARHPAADGPSKPGGVI